MFVISKFSSPFRKMLNSSGYSQGKQLIRDASNTRTRIVPHFIISRNHSSHSNEKNNKTLGNRITIPNEKLHPTIKKIANVVRVENIGRLAGAVLYPSLSLLSASGGGGLSYFFLFTPVCVGLHHLAIKDAYQTGRTLIRDGCVTESDDYLNEHIKAEIEKKDSNSRYYINFEGDLIFTTNEAKKTTKFSLEHFKGISLSVQNPHSIINAKVLPHRDSSNSISYFHLNSEIQNQVEKILEARRRRFRYPLMLSIAGSFLGGTFELSNEIFDKWSHFSGSRVGCITATGAAIGLCTNVNGVQRETDKLWNMLDALGGIKKVISSQFTNQYSNLNEDLYLKVSTFGNIDFSTEKTFSLRNTHLLKNTVKASE